ncbi:MAG: ATP-binding cassette domain-containing protein, partial [Deltaproteobacteria bacterium]|nr:ATP-binding cassette domain-containing protein [Deltaproteobacteria bacterium]
MMMGRDGEQVLEIEGLVSGYGKMEILHGVSLSVRQGEIVALIGPNGAGKSTVLKATVGMLSAISGRVTFLGEDITNKPPPYIVSRGLSFNPQGRVVFPDMDVKEHLDMGAWTIGDPKKKREAVERVFSLFPWLKEKVKTKAKQMSGGEQQMLS